MIVTLFVTNTLHYYRHKWENIKVFNTLKMYSKIFMKIKYKNSIICIFYLLYLHTDKNTLDLSPCYKKKYEQINNLIVNG